MRSLFLVMAGYCLGLAFERAALDVPTAVAILGALGLFVTASMWDIGKSRA